MAKIAVLCIDGKRSNYLALPDLDLYDQVRDCRTFPGGKPVITHAPCQQWSSMKAFARIDPEQKALAFFCLEKVMQNGGIFEHPAGSSFFQAAGIRPTISINQSWFGFPAQKKTYLYFHRCKPIAVPLSFDAVERVLNNSKSMPKSRRRPELPKWQRSIMPPAFCAWLIECINQTHK